jgi:hypothetical protein
MNFEQHVDQLHHTVLCLTIERPDIEKNQLKTFKVPPYLFLSNAQEVTARIHKQRCRLCSDLDHLSQLVSQHQVYFKSNPSLTIQL